MNSSKRHNLVAAELFSRSTLLIAENPQDYRCYLRPGYASTLLHLPGTIMVAPALLMDLFEVLWLRMPCLRGKQKVYMFWRPPTGLISALKAAF